jgi:methylmalonyl-CoA mutase
MAEFPRKSLADWEKLAREELKGGDPSGVAWATPEGITVKPLYTAADLEGLEAAGTMPGFAPYVRGPRATMYANRPWTIRQYAGFSTAEESNAFYKQGLKNGQMGLSVASTSPPIAATIPTIRAWSATSARPGWRSTRSRT